MVVESSSSVHMLLDFCLRFQGALNDQSASLAQFDQNATCGSAIWYSTNFKERTPKYWGGRHINAVT